MAFGDESSNGFFFFSQRFNFQPDDENWVGIDLINLKNRPRFNNLLFNTYNFDTKTVIFQFSSQSHPNTIELFDSFSTQQFSADFTLRKSRLHMVLSPA